jgi:IMP dehydrogenase
MKVKDISGNCSRSFHTIEQGQDVAHALKLMSGYNASALMVMDNGTPKGIFTERDLVKEHVGVLTKELHYLRDYISDLEDASYD